MRHRIERALCLALAVGMSLCGALAEADFSGEAPAAALEQPATEAVEQPAAEAVEQPATALEQPATEVVEQPAVEVADQPVTEAVEQPAVEVAEQPAVEVAEQPVVQTGEQILAEEAVEQTTVETAEQPAVEVVEQPATEVVEQPATEAVEQPATEVVEQPAVEVAEQPATEVVEQPAVEVVEQPAVEVAEQPAVQTGEQILAEEAVEQTTVETAEQPAAGSVEQSTVAAAEPIAQSAPLLVVAITSPAGLSPAEGAYAVDPALYPAVELAWSCAAACDSFAVSLTAPDGSAIYSAVQTEPLWQLSVAELAAGRYVATVTALLNGAPVAQAQLVLEVAQGTPQGGGLPGGGSHGGSRGGGSGRSSGGQAGADQGFRVTAGTALTDAHDSGSGDMTPYGAVALSADEGAMSRLTLGGEALDIALDGGTGLFTAALEGTMLSLVPAAEGGTWSLNGYALRTLARSGIEAVLLTLDGERLSLSTRSEPTGRVYGDLRAEGYVSSDFEYRVSARGTEVWVDGARYVLTEGGELALYEADLSEGN